MSGFKPSLSWFCLFGATAFFGAAVMAQKRNSEAMRAERDLLTATAAVPVAVEAVPPAPPPAATSVPAPVEMVRDEFDRAAIQRLQTEINQLRQRVAAREQALREFAAVQAAAKGRKPLITEETLSHTEWANAGRTTPEAAIETALWAGAGGDVRAFDELLVFDEEAAAAARALFQRLPADIRAEYERPERIIALFTAGDVPLTAARVLGTHEIAVNQRVVLAQIRHPDNGPEHPPRLINFQTRADSADGTWRIVVPRSVIEGYAARLTDASSNP